MRVQRALKPSDVGRLDNFIVILKASEVVKRNRAVDSHFNRAGADDICRTLNDRASKLSKGLGYTVVPVQELTYIN